MPLAKAGWFVGGREVGRGARLDLRSLPEGSSEVRAFVQGSADGRFSRSWTVRRDGARFTLEREEPERTSEPPDAPHVHPHPAPNHR